MAANGRGGPGGLEEPDDPDGSDSPDRPDAPDQSVRAGQPPGGVGRSGPIGGPAESGGPGGWWWPEGASPRRVDALLRSAMAEALGCPPDRVPAADPRRAAPDTARYTTALPLRMARAHGRSAPELAAAVAERLRGRPQVEQAGAEGGGFVGVSVAAEARAAMVRTAALDADGYLRSSLAAAGPAELSEASEFSESSGAPGASGTSDASGTSGASGSARPTRDRGAAGPSAAPAAPATPAAPAVPRSALHEAATVEEARHWAREDARRSMRAASVPRHGAPLAAGVQEGGGTSWRDPYLDGRVDGSPDGHPDGCSDPGGHPDPGGGETAAARLLAVVGEASARYAFCRSVAERPRPGEETGPGLPAVPTAEDPGVWALGTDANPAFAVRYAHAHAVATLGWVRDAQRAEPADRPVDQATGEATGQATDQLTGRPTDQPTSGPRGRPAGTGSRPGAGTGTSADSDTATGSDAHSDSDTTAPPGAVLLSDPTAAGLAAALFDGPLVLRAAERRSEPHMLVRYLESLATAYHEWRESGGGFTAETTSRPEAAGTAPASERLQLCAAAAGVLQAGLLLLGVSAPTRL